MAKQKTKTRAKKVRPATVQAKPRKIKRPDYRHFRLHRGQKPTAKHVPSVWSIYKRSVSHLKLHWKLFGGIILVYLVLTVILVKGFNSQIDISSLKDSLKELTSGLSTSLITSLTLFGVLLGTTGSVASEAGGVYQSILLIIVTLGIIWALRQTHSGSVVTVKDVFYKGLYPMVPFVLVLIVIALQLIPLAVANFLLNTVFTGIAVTPIEKGLWAVFIFMLAVLSLYMVTSSIFALYIVTLPDVRPMKALRSARELVRFRRLEIMRKVILLPIILLILGAVVMLPLILLITFLAEWIFLVLTMVGLVIAQSYMYTLYRDLL